MTAGLPAAALLDGTRGVAAHRFGDRRQSACRRGGLGARPPGDGSNHGRIVSACQLSTLQQFIEHTFEF